jgi:hypothetical protein
MRLFAVVALSSTIIAGRVAAQNRDSNGKALAPETPGVRDRTMTLTPGVIRHFADTFTVSRKADGTCDWSKTPVKPGKPGTSSVLAEASNARC